MSLLHTYREQLAQLLHRHPLVFFHLLTALAALLVGAFVLARRKGTPSHKLLGWTWVLLMASTAGASAFLRDDGILNIGGITPIHAFTVLTALVLPRGIWQIRRGNVAGHRRSMRNLYLGACALAGVFALLPARFLGRLLWQHTLGFAA